jgi:hypothetical protein
LWVLAELIQGGAQQNGMQLRAYYISHEGSVV